MTAKRSNLREDDTFRHYDCFDRQSEHGQKFAIQRAVRNERKSGQLSRRHG